MSFGYRQVESSLLSFEEKEANRAVFAEQEIGPNGPAALMGVMRAMRGASLNIISNQKLVKNIEQSFPELSDVDREVFLDYLHLDSMAKTEMIFETFLALCYALAFTRSSLNQSLIRYDSMIFHILPKLDAHILGSARDETIKNILSLPEVDSLGSIPPEERDLILKLTDRTVEKFVDVYTKAREFYESHLTAYNKMRHGMSVFIGMSGNLERSNFALDMVEALNRKPPNLVEIEGTLPVGNMLAIVPASDRVMNYYVTLAAEWDFYMHYIIGTLLAKIFNCAEGYLPCSRRGERQWDIGYISKSPMTSEEAKLFETIRKRVEPNFILPELKNTRLAFVFLETPREQIQEKLEKYYSAVVWYSGKGDHVLHKQVWTR